MGCKTNYLCIPLFSTQVFIGGTCYEVSGLGELGRLGRWAQVGWKVDTGY